MKIFRSEENVVGKFFYIPAVVLFFVLLWYFTRPVIVIESENNIIFSTSVESGYTFSTRFIHSVQKTPVEEFFVVNDNCDGFTLKSTRYRSFGVGLPFLESDGNFRREGDDFIMDNLNRSIKILDLRPGVGTELSITIDNQILPLYEIVPLGALIRISIIRRIELYRK